MEAVTRECTINLNKRLREFFTANRRTHALQVCSCPRSLSLSYTRSLFTIDRCTHKKKAPRAIRAIKKFATQMMGTNDVRIESSLNKHVWSMGVRKVPNRIRVQLQRKRNEDEEAKEEFYTKVILVVTDKGAFKGNGGGEKGLETKTIEEA